MSVPKLRFREFDKSWCSSPLKELCKINQGLQIAIEERFLDEGQNRYFYITNEFLKEGSKKSYYIENPPKSVICTDLDILMTRTGNTGQVVTGVSGAFHNNFFKIDFDRKIIDRNFFVEFLKKDTTQHWILKYAGASTIPDLNHSDFYRIVMPIPIIEEQTKIASFLSAVDEKISQLVQKHELLSQYKQGMMQKLFSQQIRFKADDGSEFREWEEKTLKDFIINHVGGASLTPNDFVSESEYEVIPKKAITFNGRLRLDENSPTYCTKLFFEENFKNTVNKDYLITVLRDLVPSGPSIGYIVQFQSSKTYILAQGVYGFQITSNLNKAFLIHFSNTKQYRLVMKSIMVGSTQVHIRNQDFFGIQIPVPCQEEQTKIANFLSSIDQKIVVVAQQIEQAKQWKKGLLQQMFV